MSGIPSIWDTPISLDEHSSLKENIENGLSYSYRNVDSSIHMDHKSALLSLPGVFGLQDMGKNSVVLAKCIAGVGIVLNKTLVEKSTAYANSMANEPGGIAELYQDLNIIRYIAIMQETLEHELGHWKFHCDGVKAPGYVLLLPSIFLLWLSHSFHADNTS
jgi:hypothetical protein